MTKTTGLSALFLLILVAIAAGAQALVPGSCSDWLTTCPQVVATEQTLLSDNVRDEDDVFPAQ